MSHSFIHMHNFFVFLKILIISRFSCYVIVVIALLLRHLVQWKLAELRPASFWRIIRSPSIEFDAWVGWDANVRGKVEVWRRIALAFDLVARAQIFRISRQESITWCGRRGRWWRVVGARWRHEDSHDSVRVTSELTLEALKLQKSENFHIKKLLAHIDYMYNKLTCSMKWKFGEMSGFLARTKLNASFMHSPLVDIK